MDVAICGNVISVREEWYKLVNKVEIEHMAKRMRLLSLEMAHNAGKNGAHLGGGLSAIEIFAVLYGEILQVDSDNPNWSERDIVLLGKGHGVLAYYTALYEKGFLSREDIESFENNGTKFIGHPVKNVAKGIEYSSGSLGMALSVGAGMALSAKRRGSRKKIYVILGDGECQEGSIWEAMFFAHKYKLNNLIVVIDNNQIQSDGFTVEVGGYDNLESKMQSFGADVLSVDGHDIERLIQAFRYECDSKPKVIIANTVKGRGVSFMENDYKWHHAVLNEEQYKFAVEEVVGGAYAGSES